MTLILKDDLSMTISVFISHVATFCSILLLNIADCENHYKPGDNT